MLRSPAVIVETSLTWRRHQAVSNRFARTSLLWLDASDKALCWSATGDGVIGKKDNDGSYDRNDHAG